MIVYAATLKLNNSEFRELMKPVRGKGGFQNLQKDFQRQSDPDTRIIILTWQQTARAYRYTSKYGKGGFQNRLLPMSMIKLINAMVESRTDEDDE